MSPGADPMPEHVFWLEWYAEHYERERQKREQEAAAAQARHMEIIREAQEQEAIAKEYARRARAEWEASARTAGAAE